MAMPFRIALDEPTSDSDAHAAVATFHAELEWADGVFSLWTEDSTMSRFNRGELAIDDGPPELLEVLQTCEWYRGATGGAFDARGPVGLDPTGLVKGWAVARAVRALAGVASAWMVDASGDVLVSGSRADASPWRVGIADPAVKGDPNGMATVDVVDLGGEHRALATSGASQRGAHIWDPATGEAAHHVVQASAIATGLVDADVWATAIVAGGMEAFRAAAAYGVEALVVLRRRDDGAYDSVSTAGWPSRA